MAFPSPPTSVGVKPEMVLHGAVAHDHVRHGADGSSLVQTPTAAPRVQLGNATVRSASEVREGGESGQVRAGHLGDRTRLQGWKSSRIAY